MGKIQCKYAQQVLFAMYREIALAAARVVKCRETIQTSVTDGDNGFRSFKRTVPIFCRCPMGLCERSARSNENSVNDPFSLRDL
jgi:hypothetical protein